MKETQAEKRILTHVQKCNAIDSLAGLSTSPDDKNFANPEFKFVRRLHDAGKIKWIAYTNALGAGWCTSDNVSKFSKSTTP